MDLPEFLLMASELEMLASKLYESLAGLSSVPGISRRLNALANEETNHANFLVMGNKYSQGLSDVFSSDKMDDDDLRAVIEEAKRLQAQIIPGFSVREGLKIMSEFERRFEKIHSEASENFKEPSLRNFFVDLMRWDQSHILVLKGLIESSGEK